MSDVFVHPQALNDCESVGSGTRIWAFAHVMQGARVGRQCNLGEHTFVETGAVVGDGVTVKNNVSVWSGVTLEDHVFVGYAIRFFGGGSADYGNAPPAEWGALGAKAEAATFLTAGGV